MNREQVIRMATEAGLLEPGYIHGNTVIAELERFAALVAAAERQKRKADEMMAECMDMVRQELIAAGLVDSSVPPMMLPQAIFSAHCAAVAAEREACAIACEVHATYVINDGKQPAWAIANECAAAIRARGNP